MLCSHVLKSHKFVTELCACVCMSVYVCVSHQVMLNVITPHMLSPVCPCSLSPVRRKNCEAQAFIFQQLKKKDDYLQPNTYSLWHSCHIIHRQSYLTYIITYEVTRKLFLQSCKPVKLIIVSVCGQNTKVSTKQWWRDLSILWDS